jgi:hypothetical protein
MSNCTLAFHCCRYKTVQQLLLCGFFGGYEILLRPEELLKYVLKVLFKLSQPHRSS